MIIYKKDSKGKLRTLEFLTEGADLIQISGIIDGKKVTARSTCKPKNIGKKNETTAEQQAILEMESKIKKKLRKEYFKTMDEALNTKIILPMLADKFDKFGKNIKWGYEHVFAQPKLDGMRAFFIFEGGSIKVISRDNVEIKTVEHIKAELMNHYQEGLILDGELYAHGFTFQENMKFIKKYRPGLTELVKLHLYDIADENMEYTERRKFISEWISGKNLETVEEVESFPINCKDDLDEYHSIFLSQGYEGSIIRLGRGKYKLNGRSPYLLKYKDFIDETFEIVDVVPSEKRPTQGKFVLKTKVEGTDDFDCGMKYSHSEREEILRNKHKYIGKIAEIRFFEYTDIGLPRFPVCVGIRLDKHVAD